MTMPDHVSSGGAQLHHRARWGLLSIRAIHYTTWVLYYLFHFWRYPVWVR